jgi:hypothetical protein
VKPVRGIRTALAGAACLILLGSASAGTSTQMRPCADSPNTPLSDLTRPYRGLEPGLYPGGRNTPSEAHLESGLATAARIRPVDAGGNPSPDGRIVLVAIGMSNTSSEFQRFIDDTRGVSGLNPRLSIVNGALSGADASMWADASSRPWQQLAATLKSGGRAAMSAAQVQAIWIKQAHLRTIAFPGELDAFAGNLDAAIETASRMFPNLRIVYVSSRTRSGAESRRGPGEPQAYETGFAVRRLIQKRFGAKGPWVSWGPYLWANATPRSDGTRWECGDLQQDLLHPSKSGDSKVAAHLLSFFATAPTSASWFLDPARRLEAAAALRASATEGPAPLAVTFSTEAPGGRRFWGFGDGTTSQAASPTKTFHMPGTYDVRLTSVDSQGRWIRGASRIVVTAGAR